MKQLREIRNIKVLMYHRVVSDPEVINNYLYAVHTDHFRQHLQLLDRFNFTPITFEDYQLYLDGKLTLPKKPIILTFDDGHLDTYEIAAPLLEEFNMRAVVFPVGNRDLNYAHWDEAHTGLKFPLMNDDQIRELRTKGFEIGAHTMNHRILPHLTLDSCVDEIMGSKESMEKLLEQDIISFSYPYGRLDNRIRAVVRSAGFNFACGVYTGPARFGEDRFDFRRLTINKDTGLTNFMLRVLTPYEYAEWMIDKIRHPETDSPEKDDPEIEDKLHELLNEKTTNFQNTEPSKHFIS
jgi:peptidoglycan/xylan/chitin deacetylase (PgdA/CDA1 family)